MIGVVPLALDTTDRNFARATFGPDHYITDSRKAWSRTTGNPAVALRSALMQGASDSPLDERIQQIIIPCHCFKR